MLHKKRKPSTFTSSSGVDCKYGTAKNNMLHSKSTYFYRWVSNLGVARRSYNSTNGKTSSKVGHDFTNEFRESSHHCEKSNTASGTAHAILTRSRRQTNSYSKITDRPGYIVPVGCGIALLLGLGIMLNPAINSAEEVHAATDSDKCMNGEASSTGQCPMELSLTMSGTNGTGAYEEAGATQLEVGKTTYRSYDFKVSATDIDKDGYKLYATAVETKLGEIDLTNQLVNADYPDKETFIPISTAEGVVGENITAGQWGYAIAGGGVDSILPTVDTANTNPGSLIYKAVPTNQTTPIATGTETTTIDSGIPDNPATVPDEYRLIFGAKADEGMASGHYRTQVMLSLVADPKTVLRTMQKFADNATCGTLDVGDSLQLVDDRTRSGIADQKTYWVTKLKDNKCWMTQNLDLPLKQGDVLKPADTDVAAEYTVENLGNYRDPGMINYKVSAANGDFGSACGDPAGSGCSAYFETYAGSIDGDTTAHYLIGNYYPWTIAMAGKTAENQGSICPKGWKLPTQTEYGTITSLGNSAAGANAVRKDPYYFPAAGYYGSDWRYVASGGTYWSSTPSSSNAYSLGFFSSNLNMGSNGKSGGFPVRCVVK